MKRLFFTGLLAAGGIMAHAQEADSIYFNLYTDSLKKGFFNYINVEGRVQGAWRPMDSTFLIFSANTGYFLGNDLFIDSSYTGDSVHVRVALRSDARKVKEITIPIRKRGFDEPLPSDDMIMDGMRRGKRKS